MTKANLRIKLLSARSSREDLATKAAQIWKEIDNSAGPTSDEFLRLRKELVGVTESRIIIEEEIEAIVDELLDESVVEEPTVRVRVKTKATEVKDGLVNRLKNITWKQAAVGAAVVVGGVVAAKYLRGGELPPLPEVGPV